LYKIYKKCKGSDIEDLLLKNRNYVSWIERPLQFPVTIISQKGSFGDEYYGILEYQSRDEKVIALSHSVKTIKIRREFFFDLFKNFES
jgi:hypothetical protein